MDAASPEFYTRVPKLSLTNVEKWPVTKNGLSLDVMIRYSPAKINLGLQIIMRRGDGYHDIQTIMHHAGLCDILETRASAPGSQPLKFSQSGIQLESGDQKNLCISAWEIFQKEAPLPPLEIHLHKQIPVGAGLGGGSSNATHTLLAINRIMGDPLPMGTLHRMASSLGSDCPFFLHDRAMLAEGRGEILTPMEWSLKGKYLVLFNRGIHISTAQAYAGIQPAPSGFDLRELPHLSFDSWKKYVTNDFEVPVFRAHPELEALKAAIYSAGAGYASLSGSGSALYGIFEELPDLPEPLQRFAIWKGEL
jgi:4-diphosphocytidyl-2-C-methyl-D-erythritol kinase